MRSVLTRHKLPALGHNSQLLSKRSPSSLAHHLPRPVAPSVVHLSSTMSGKENVELSSEVEALRKQLASLQVRCTEGLLRVSAPT